MAIALPDFTLEQRALVTLAEKDLRALWKTLDLNKPLVVARTLEQYLPLLVQKYGEMGAAAAADFYDELRDASPVVKRRYRAALASPIPEEQAAASTRWAVGPLFKENDVAALDNLIYVTDRLVKQHGRDTIAFNAKSDPAQARFARVPQGKTCEFCLMLGSRGAVYATSQTAGELIKFHGHCDCAIVPVWGHNDLDRLKEDGYDPQSLHKQWQDVRKNT